MRDEDRTMTNRTPVDRHRSLRLLSALVGRSVALGACTNTTGEVVTASVPNDYRLRHPSAIQEADRSVVIFVGHARGGRRASPLAAILGLAQTWGRHAERTGCGGFMPRSSGAARGKRRAFTGNYVASLPSGRPSNARDDQAE